MIAVAMLGAGALLVTIYATEQRVRVDQQLPDRVGDVSETTAAVNRVNEEGANAITLRREMQRRGIDDPRFVTAARAAWINRRTTVVVRFKVLIARGYPARAGMNRPSAVAGERRG